MRELQNKNIFVSERFENRESLKREGYYSVSHLLHHVHVRFGDGHTETFQILAGSHKDGATKWQAFGGGAKLTEKGIEHLRQKYGDSIRFRGGEESDDARFYLTMPTTNVVATDGSITEEDEYSRKALEPFVSINGGLLESSIERELLHEFEEVAPGLDFEPNKAHVTHVGVVSPRKWNEQGSSRSDGAVRYDRIFHLFDITLDESQFEHLRNSPNVRILSVKDKRDIFNATQNDKVLANLRDGSIVAENIFPDFET